MKQCLLRNGVRWQVAWLPVQFAAFGKWVKLRDEDGWRVVAVYPLYQESVDVPHGYLSGGVFHK